MLWHACAPAASPESRAETRICRQPRSWGMRPHCMVGWALWTHRLQHAAASAAGHDCPCGNVLLSLMAGKAVAIHLGFRVQSVSHSSVGCPSSCGMRLRFGRFGGCSRLQTAIADQSEGARLARLLCCSLALVSGPAGCSACASSWCGRPVEASDCIRSGGGGSCRARAPRRHQRLHARRPPPCPPGLPPLPGAQTAAMDTCMQRSCFPTHCSQCVAGRP